MPHDLDLESLHDSLVDPMMSSLMSLNEISHRYPDCVSFAAGRPAEDWFDTADITRYIDRYSDHLRSLGSTETEVRREILQYGRTNGVIHGLIAQHLAVDEGVDVPAESIVVTVGAQEGLYLVLRALRATPSDAVIAVSPTYVGIAGAARLVDSPLLTVRGGESGIDIADLRAVTAAARDCGLRPRTLYVIPDVSNPSGVSMDVPTRRQLLEVAGELDLIVLEDNAYGVFAGAPRLPTLKSLDHARRVVRVASFAKTVWPGARVGYLVADQRVGARDGSVAPTMLADQLGLIKSMLTVNTSPIAQAVVGGALLAHGGSLVAANERQIALYQRNLALMLAGLGTRFADTPGVSWNSPTGGFFLAVRVPFRADAALLERSAREHGVLWTPMSNFYVDCGGSHDIRLAFSQMDPAILDEGLDRFAGFVHATAAES